MSELFGAPSGIIAHTQELDTKAATLQRYAQIEHTKALEQQENQRIAMAKEKYAADRAAAVQKLQQEQAKLITLANAGSEAMMEGPDGEQIPIADRMDTMSHRLLSAGYVKDAADLATKASTVRASDARALSSAAQAQVKLLDQTVKAHEDLYNFLAASNDPKSFDAAKMLYMSQHPEEEIPPELAQYNPQVIDVLRKTTKTGMESTKAQAQALRDQATEDYRKKSLSQRERHANAVDARADADRTLRATIAASRAKVVGKKPVIGAPNRDMVQAAQAMVMKDYPDMAPDLTLGTNILASTAAYDLASEAKAAMANNPGLSASEAMGQVYATMQANGSFTTEVAPKKKIGEWEVPYTGGEKSTKYQRKGKSGGAAAPASGSGAAPTSPLPLPPKGTALVDGAFYNTPKGVVQWNAKTKKATVIPGGAGVRGASKAAGGPDEAEAEDNLAEEEQE